MALRKPKPEFEDDENTQVADKPETETQAEAAEVQTDEVKKEAPSEEDKVKVSASQAIAKAQNTAVGAPSSYAPAFKTLENVIDPSTMDFDTFPRVVVGLDGFSDEDDTDLGKVIKIRLMSWNIRFVASPGVMNDESTEDVRYSLDGVTIDETGESLADYVQMLRTTKGYTEASIKKYLALYGFLTEANGEPIDEEAQEIVSVQVPPRSVAKFSGFQVQTGVKVSKGVLDEPEEITLTQVKKAGKSQKYAGIEFSL